MLGELARGIPLDAERLAARACARHGLPRFDPRYGDVAEALGRFTESVRREAELDLGHRLILLHELRMLLDRRARIETAAADLGDGGRPRAPVVVVGLPRSGTTHLHRLLALHPGLRAPLYWELRHPAPPGPGIADRRRVRAEREVRMALRRVPGYRAVHPLAVNEPEECVIATVHSFLSVTLGDRARAPDYLAWFLDQDLTPSWRLHRVVLRLMQRAGPHVMGSRRWLLKAPEHLFSLDVLLREYPDARIVWIHRDPAEVAPSACNLTAQNRRFVGPTQDPRVVGPEWLSLWGEAVRRASTAHRARPEAFLDVDFRDLLHRPRALLATIRSWLGLPHAPHDTIVAVHLDRMPRPPPSHTRSLADFGLAGEQLTVLRPAIP